MAPFVETEFFEINAFQQLSHLKTVSNYREAKTMVNELRRKPHVAAGTTYRMMFAEDQNHAERLLTEKRQARPMGEHD